VDERVFMFVQYFTLPRQKKYKIKIRIKVAFNTTKLQFSFILEPSIE